MKFRDLAAAFAALTVSASPAMAQAVERVGAPVSDANQMGGGSSTLLLILAIVLIGAGIYFLADSNNKPKSP